MRDVKHSICIALVAFMLAAGAVASADPAAALAPPASDDFSSPTLDPRWALVDTVGGSGVTVTGTNALINVPGGDSHDAWAGANRAPRLLQAVSNADFEVEVKFESAPSSRYQIQGIIAEQDGLNYARFDFVNDGSRTNLFAATIAGGTPTTRYKAAVPVPTGGGPVWLRVRRSGSAFSQSWSTDGAVFTAGANFSANLAVAKVGPFAGNHEKPASAAPAFTTSVDYFFNTASPISPEDGGGSSDDTAPQITALNAAPAATGASITWTTDEPATSVVDYGPTAALGTTATAAGLVSSHNVGLTGLTCDTLHYYQVRSADASGNAAASPVATFTTTACPLPPAGPAPDDFSSPTLDPRWALVNPVGDGTVRVVDGHVELSVPAGVSHDPWVGGNKSVRIMQPVSDGDFAVEVRFDSTPSKKFQIQGLIVEQDAGHWLRFDVLHDGGSRRAFAASVTGGSPKTRANASIPNGGSSVWIRVSRVGDQWVHAWSLDGTTFTELPGFTHQLEVRQLGPFAANHGSPASTSPAFTASVDYLHEGPVSDGSGSGIDGLMATPSANGSWVRWKTATPATTTVQYGLTPAYGTTKSVGASSHEHALVLTDLGCATTYHFRAQSQGAEGTLSSPDGTFTTLPCSAAVTRPFQREVVAPTADRPEGKSIADFDGDGLSDAAFGQAEGSPGGLYWLKAPSWNRFTVSAANHFGEDMQAGDMDGDGDVDLVAGSESRGTRWFSNPLRNGGDPTTGPWVERTVNAIYTHDLELVDMDRDGRLDVVTEHGVYLNQVSGSWALVGRSGIDRATDYPGTGVGDVNGDGFPDIVAALPVAPYSVAWFENPLGSGRPISGTWTSRVVGPGPGSEQWKGTFAVTDVNRDGRADIVSVPMWVNHTSLRWFAGPADPSTTAPWTRHEVDSSFTGVHTMKVLDVNGDGQPDLVLVEQEQTPQRRIAVMYGVDAGAGWVLQVLATTGGHNTKVGDIGNDGNADLLVANHGYFGAETSLQLWRSGPP